MNHRAAHFVLALLVGLPLACGSDGGNGNSGTTTTTIPDPGDLAPVDWSQAGYPGDIPDVAANVIDVTTVGAACDGSSDDHGAIQAAIDSAPDPAVILLPTGTCVIEAQLSMQSGVVLRGAGSDATVLSCRSEEGCIAVAGSPAGEYVAIQSGLAQGSSQIEVADASGFVVGQGAEIRQEAIVPAEADWGDHNVGQMAKIVAIDGDTLNIDPPLHITLLAGSHPEARPLVWVEQVGIEDLTLRRIDAGGSSGSNISMRRAADSWVRRIESDYTEKYHLAISESLHLEIRDSYIHDAKSRGDGGQGYGASLGRFATAILVENNIFSDTRHAMIVQIGTSGCVFGYNYAQRNYSDDGWDKTTISLHGHYPFMNLWEANIVGYVGVGDFWGPAGPGNTFFRNRVLGTDQHENFGDRRGIDLEEYHGTQYVIGNEVMAEGIYGDMSDVVLHGNNVNGEVTWDPNMPEQTLPDSYYLSAKPAFYGTLDWPSMGGDMVSGEGSIPALERWTQGAPVPQP